MGSTYSVGKQAAAMVAPNGVIFYALFEQSYESNTYPHNPHWCAVYFGTAAACMDRIIAHASDCEGGMLKERGGMTTPSAYIKHWREAMANPVTLRKGVATAEFGNGIYEIPEDNRATIEAILANHGHPGVVGNKVAIDFGAQPELLQAIIDGKTSTWIFLDRSDVISESAKDWAAYSPTLCEGVLPEFSVFYIQGKPNWEHDYWLQVNDQMFSLGWKCSVIGHLINRYAKASERAIPGSAEAVIKKIRVIIKKAVPFPMEQRVRIDVAKAEDRYRKSLFEQLATKLAVKNEGVIETTIKSLVSADALYAFKSMTDCMVSFIDVPTSPANGQQQELLAA